MQSNISNIFDAHPCRWSYSRLTVMLLIKQMIFPEEVLDIVPYRSGMLTFMYTLNPLKRHADESYNNWLCKKYKPPSAPVRIK